MLPLSKNNGVFNQMASTSSTSESATHSSSRPREDDTSDESPSAKRRKLSRSQSPGSAVNMNTNVDDREREETLKSVGSSKSPKSMLEGEEDIIDRQDELLDGCMSHGNSPGHSEKLSQDTRADAASETLHTEPMNTPEASHERRGVASSSASASASSDGCSQPAVLRGRSASIASSFADGTAPMSDVTAPMMNDVSTPINDVTAPMSDVTTSMSDVTTPMNDVTVPKCDVTTSGSDATTQSEKSNSTKDNATSGVGQQRPSRANSIDSASSHTLPPSADAYERKMSMSISPSPARRVRHAVATAESLIKGEKSNTKSVRRLKLGRGRVRRSKRPLEASPGCLVNRRVSVYWGFYKQWFSGILVDYDHGKYRIEYDDGDRRRIVLSDELVQWEDEHATTSHISDSEDGSDGEFRVNGRRQAARSRRSGGGNSGASVAAASSVSGDGTPSPRSRKRRRGSQDGDANGNSSGDDTPVRQSGRQRRMPDRLISAPRGVTARYVTPDPAESDVNLYRVDCPHCAKGNTFSIGAFIPFKPVPCDHCQKMFNIEPADNADGLEAVACSEHDIALDDDESRSDDHSAGNGDDSDEEEYCLCRGPDDGRPMVECDACGEWFHYSCVGFRKPRGTRKFEWVCPRCRVEVPELKFPMQSRCPTCRVSNLCVVPRRSDGSYYELFRVKCGNLTCATSYKLKSSDIAQANPILAMKDEGSGKKADRQNSGHRPTVAKLEASEFVKRLAPPLHAWYEVRLPDYTRVEQPYFYNVETGVSTWKRPTPPPRSSPSANPPRKRQRTSTGTARSGESEDEVRRATEAAASPVANRVISSSRSRSRSRSPTPDPPLARSVSRGSSSGTSPTRSTESPRGSSGVISTDKSPAKSTDSPQTNEADAPLGRRNPPPVGKSHPPPLERHSPSPSPDRRRSAANPIGDAASLITDAPSSVRDAANPTSDAANPICDADAAVAMEDAASVDSSGCANTSPPADLVSSVGGARGEESAGLIETSPVAEHRDDDSHVAMAGAFTPPRVVSSARDNSASTTPTTSQSAAQPNAPTTTVSAAPDVTASVTVPNSGGVGNSESSTSTGTESAAPEAPTYPKSTSAAAHKSAAAVTSVGNSGGSTSTAGTESAAPAAPTDPSHTLAVAKNDAAAASTDLSGNLQRKLAASDEVQAVSQTPSCPSNSQTLSAAVHEGDTGAIDKSNGQVTLPSGAEESCEQQGFGAKAANGKANGENENGTAAPSCEVKVGTPETPPEPPAADESAAVSRSEVNVGETPTSLTGNEVAKPDKLQPVGESKKSSNTKPNSEGGEAPTRVLANDVAKPDTVRHVDENLSGLNAKGSGGEAPTSVSDKEVTKPDTVRPLDEDLNGSSGKAPTGVDDETLESHDSANASSFKVQTAGKVQSILWK